MFDAQWREKRLKSHADSSRVVVDYVRSGMVENSYLGNTEVDNEWRVLWIRQRTTSCVVTTEVRCTVDDDTLDGHAETAVQSNGAVGLQCLLDAVNQSVVLTVSSSLSDISTQAGTGVIQGVDEAE